MDLNKLVINEFVKSKLTTELLPKTNEIVQEQAKKFGMAAVIAGGAPRDATFGLMPNDIDIFLDSSKLSSDETEDATLIIAFETMTALHDIFNSDVDVYRQTDSSYDNVEGSKNWVIYNGMWTPFFNDPNEIVDPQDGLPAIVGSTYGTQLQFISRPTPEIVSPENFVKEFDYGLVKTWVDSQSGEIKYSDEFMKEFSSKEILSSSANTTRRITDFTSRLRKFWKEFSIKKNYEEAKIVKSRYSKYLNSPTVDQQMQHQWLQNAFNQVQAQQAIPQNQQALALPINQEPDIEF